jgi:hypothetical protein
MKPPVLLLASAVGLAMMAIGAQAQITMVDRDRFGNLSMLRTTYPDGSTSTAYYDYDRNNNLESIRRTSTPATPVAPAPTPPPLPVFAPYVNREYNHNGQAIKKAPDRGPSQIQLPITVTSESAAEVHAASLAGAARVKAEKEAEAKANAAKDKGNVKSSKRTDSKNGE